MFIFIEKIFLLNMKFFKKLFPILFMAFFICCTKNSVVGDIQPTSIQIFNYYYSTTKTFSLLQGKDTVLSNVGFDVASKVASGAPGFYSLLFQDNTKDTTILKGNINLQSGKRYSMFVVRDSANNSDAVHYSLVTSNTTDKMPPYDSCRVRILNFARGILYTNFRFIINQGVGYGQYSPFFESQYINGRTYLDNNNNALFAQYFTVPAGTAESPLSYKIKIVNGMPNAAADTTKAIMDSTYFTFQKQKLYTLILLGRFDSASAANHHYTYPDSFRLKIISEDPL